MNTPVPAGNTSGPPSPAPASNRLIPASILVGAIIVAAGIGLPLWWTTRAPASTPTSSEKVAEVAPPPPVDVEYHWLVCATVTPEDGTKPILTKDGELVREKDGHPVKYVLTRGLMNHRREMKFDEVWNSLTENSREVMFVHGLQTKPTCTTKPDASGEFEVAETAHVFANDAYPEESHCQVDGKDAKHLVVQWLCADRTGQLVSTQDIERSLSEISVPVKRLDGVSARCQPGNTLNACKRKSESEDVIASR